MYNSKVSSFVDIDQRTYSFALRIVRLVLYLRKQKLLYSLLDQVLRSGTSVGANVEEAQNAGSKKEFIHSMTIALKEARETKYWLRLLLDSNLVTHQQVDELVSENGELVRILITIVKRSKES